MTRDIITRCTRTCLNFGFQRSVFRCECYHPIFCFNQDGKMEAALLRHGNVASSYD